MKEARKSELIGSILSIQLNAIDFGLAECARGFRDGEAHPMHGGSFEQSSFPNYVKALRENEFAYRGMLLGREIAKVAPM
jgi:hypothetical protein